MPNPSIHIKLFDLIFLLTLTCSTSFAQICSEKNEYCLSCDASGKCIMCADSYLSETNTCIPVLSKVDYCFSYKADGLCLVCQHGYYLGSDNKCAKITVNNCALFDPASNKCISCYDNVQIQNDGSCEDKSQKCIVLDCTLCSLSGAVSNCEMCNEGYMISTSNDHKSCIRETKSVEHCFKVLTDDYLKCYVCDPLYYNYKGGCFESTQYTISMGSAVLCVGVFMAVISLSFF